MGLPGPKTLNHQRTPFPIIGSQLFKHEHATSCVTIPKLYECQGDIRVFVQLNMTKPTQSCLYAPAPGNNLCRKLSPMLPSKPSLLPVYKARPFSPKPIPPRLLIHHLLHILLPGVWAKSRMRFLIPCSCMFCSYNPTHLFAQLHLWAAHDTIFLIYTSTVDFGHINLHSVLLSSGLTTFVSKIPLPQGLCTGCPRPRMFFLQFPEHDCLSFEIFA